MFQRVPQQTFFGVYAGEVYPIDVPLRVARRFESVCQRLSTHRPGWFIQYLASVQNYGGRTLSIRTIKRFVRYYEYSEKRMKK